MNICNNTTKTPNKVVPGNLYVWDTTGGVRLCILDENTGNMMMVRLDTGAVTNHDPSSGFQFSKYTDVTHQFCLQEV